MKLNFLLFLVPFDPFTVDQQPVCRNCNNILIENDTCKLFGKINIVTGEKTFLSCNIARTNKTLCGESGTFYTRYIPFQNTIIKKL